MHGGRSDITKDETTKKQTIKVLDAIPLVVGGYLHEPFRDEKSVSTPTSTTSQSLCLHAALYIIAFEIDNRIRAQRICLQYNYSEYVQSSTI